MDQNLALCAVLYFDQAQRGKDYRLDQRGTAFVDRLTDEGMRFFFSQYWVSADMTISPAQMDLVETNKITACDDFEAIFKLGWIPIGSFRNGDFLCVALESPHPVSILSHDSLWEDQRADFAQIDSRFEWFLIRIAEKRFIPIDYSQCMDLNDMVAADARPKREARKR